MNTPAAGKQQIVDRARDRGIRVACHTWLQSFKELWRLRQYISSEGSKLSAKGSSNASPTPSLNWIGRIKASLVVFPQRDP